MKLYILRDEFIIMKIKKTNILRYVTFINDRKVK